MKNQQQKQSSSSSPMLLFAQNSHLAKILSCFLLFGAGIAFGFIFSSYFTTAPLFSVQNIQSSNSWRTSPPTPRLPSSFPSSSSLPPHLDSSISSPPPPYSFSLSSSFSTPRPLLISSLSPPPPPPPPPVFTLPPPIDETTPHIELNNQMGQKFITHPIFSDVELLKKACLVPRASTHPQKVAFMYLIRGTLPFMPLWEKFFRGHEGLFSIYVHADPHYGETVPEDSVFANRRIPSKVSFSSSSSSSSSSFCNYLRFS